jgi:hypothetical protein
LQMQWFHMKNSATGEMIEYKNTIIIAAIGTCLNITTHLAAFIDLLICLVRIFTGDGFPFSKQNPGFDWLIQFLNFGGAVNSKLPCMRRIFGASAGEKDPLVHYYLDKVYAPQVATIFFCYSSQSLCFCLTLYMNCAVARACAQGRRKGPRREVHHCRVAQW